jgi:ribonucleases P/MRP protein subunit RPP40
LIFNCDPAKSIQPSVSVPLLTLPDARCGSTQEHLHEYCLELSEWLALVSIQSRRISSSDSVDPYISRYQVPQRKEATAESVITVKWHGFLSPLWILQLFISLL